jgi:hypothetical protein
MGNHRFDAEPENAPGDFYVERGQCIICMLPVETAPGIFGFHDASTVSGSHAGSHCYVARQPSSSAEVASAVEALTHSCCQAIRYAGTDPDIIARIRAASHCTHLCDQLY